jgi:hypothetical protein
MSHKPSKPGRERWADIKGGMAFIIPVQLTRHESYRLLSPWAHKLLADLSGQYSGYNNGYLCAAWTLMKERGWRSKTTLGKAAAELEHFCIIERTQQGGRNKPNLYAFTFRRIDRIEGRRLDVGATSKPSDAWLGTFPAFRYAAQPRIASPARGLTAQLQAQQVDSDCPFNGLGKEH